MPPSPASGWLLHDCFHLRPRFDLPSSNQETFDGVCGPICVHKLHKASTHSLVETSKIHVRDNISIRLMGNMGSARLCEVVMSDDHVGEKWRVWVCERSVYKIDVPPSPQS